MLFNSHAFIFGFFPVVLAAFLVIARWRPEWAAGWLAAASVTFYGLGSPPRHVLILLLSIAFNYAIGRWLARSEMDRGLRKRILVFGVMVNLLLIGYFKYAGFLLGVFGWPIEGISLPLGISFFTFTQIAFLVDAYRGLAREYNPVHYSLFVTYFPHLVAGPILHHKEMMPQFRMMVMYRPGWHDLSLGLSVFAVGLAKKTFLADNFAPYADSVFSNAALWPLTPAEAWTGATAYALQIYFDFSGYSDMAIGLSRTIGVRLPLNFNSPYKACSIIDFWRRWHMTLSCFLRDYLYFALGGNRKGPLRRYVNLMTTMLLGGLWHGAGWNFLVWGGLHGVYLVINHLWSGAGWRLPRAVGWGATFMAVVVAWVFFRADDLGTAKAILSAMGGGNGLSLPSALRPWLLPWASHFPGVSFGGFFRLELQPPPETLFLLGTGLLLAILAPNTQEVFGRFGIALGQTTQSAGRLEWKPRPIWGIGLGMALAVAVFAASGDSPFLYFRF